MEKDNFKTSIPEEQIEIDIKQLWQYLTELYGKNLMPNKDYMKELLNLEDTINEDTMKDICNSINISNYLPTNFSEYLTNLTRLDLSNNDLTDLPYCLSLLKSLEYLALNDNQFSYLPSVIGDLKALKSLKVHRNNIKEVPENIGNLINLEDLDLSFNKLTKIPLTCKKLHRLKYLFLEDNKFLKIPDCITTGMKNLEILNLSQNKFIILDIPLCSIHITKLYARDNDICLAFPKWILTPKYYKMEEVSLDYTVFKQFDFPTEATVSNIKKISMVECRLSGRVFQNITRRLKCPESINIGNNLNTPRSNSFWVLPIEDIKNKSNLKEISARQTGIPMIPKCVNELVNIIMIDVSFNNISWLPDEIHYMKNLQTIIINNNSLVYLPDSIGQLQSLQILKANHNILTRIPSSMVYVNSLKFLDLYNNEFLSAKDVNVNMSCLRGMDLEQNFFPTTDLPITKNHYENLRSALLEQWSERSEEPIGPRILPIYSEDESYHLYNYTSDISDNEQLNEPYNSVELLEENWDSDSADEFDPNEFKEPKPRPNLSYCDLTMFRQQFCPADIHAEPIAKRITEMINNGSLLWDVEFEEGQFDDIFDDEI